MKPTTFNFDIVQINLALFRINHSIIEHMAFSYSSWNSKHYFKNF